MNTLIFIKDVVLAFLLTIGLVLIGLIPLIIYLLMGGTDPDADYCLRILGFVIVVLLMGYVCNRK
ncbi:hypothetical protein [Escherichia phage vB_EcoM_JNE01]|nr:hypothetical protein [Escherichia phage vB_EcoM_JNE01]